MTQALPLTDRFKSALEYATVVHGGQARKGSSVPYVSHVLAVCAEAFRQPDATAIVGELERVVSKLEAELQRR